MKNFLIVAFLTLFVNVSFAQEKDKEDDIIDNKEAAFPAEFINGGETGMMKLLADNIKYPAESKFNNKQGLVEVVVIIEKNGNVDEPFILTEVDKSLDAEAIRVVKLLKFKPAKDEKGNLLVTHITIAINFNIESVENETEIVTDSVTTKGTTLSIITTRVFNDIIENAILQIPASFENGEESLKKFINEKMIYPKFCKENKIQGRVVMKFVVEKDGTLSNVTILKKVNELLDEEAIRLVKSMPRWKPGSNDGKPVRAYFTLPIAFSVKE
jgi:TonB family protein